MLRVVLLQVCGVRSVPSINSTPTRPTRPTRPQQSSYNTRLFKEPAGGDNGNGNGNGNGGAPSFVVRQAAAKPTDAAAVEAEALPGGAGSVKVCVLTGECIGRIGRRCPTFIICTYIRVLHVHLITIYKCNTRALYSYIHTHKT